MVIKAVVASAAAATPVTPSSTIIVRSNLATTATTSTTTTTTTTATDRRSYSSFLARNGPRWTTALWCGRQISVRRYRVRPSYGVATPGSEPYDDNNNNSRQHEGGSAGSNESIVSKSPFIFETGFALHAKRPSRAFPPPFLSPPSSSFSEPLTTHDLNQDKRLSLRGERIRALTNGDDAVLASQNFLGVNDGVGAWATRPRGHAA